MCSQFPSFTDHWFLLTSTMYETILLSRYPCLLRTVISPTIICLGAEFKRPLDLSIVVSGIANAAYNAHHCSVPIEQWQPTLTNSKADTMQYKNPYSEAEYVDPRVENFSSFVLLSPWPYVFMVVWTF